MPRLGQLQHAGKAVARSKFAGMTDENSPELPGSSRGESTGWWGRWLALGGARAAREAVWFEKSATNFLEISDPRHVRAAMVSGVGYNRAMTNIATLQPGQVESSENGERFGRSQGGHLVQLRRRKSEPGFAVTVDAEPRPEVPAELLTHEWAAANAAFDRLMREY
jgi:hypothetical protein